MLNLVFVKKSYKRGVTCVGQNHNLVARLEDSLLVWIDVHGVVTLVVDTHSYGHLKHAPAVNKFQVSLVAM